MPDDQFEFDTALRHASVTFRLRGEAQRLEWAAKGDKGIVIVDGGCATSPIGTKGIGLTQESLVTGRIMGRRLDESRMDFGSMELVVGLNTC